MKWRIIQLRVEFVAYSQINCHFGCGEMLYVCMIAFEKIFFNEGIWFEFRWAANVDFFFLRTVKVGLVLFSLLAPLLNIRIANGKFPLRFFRRPAEAARVNLENTDNCFIYMSAWSWQSEKGHKSSLKFHEYKHKGKVLEIAHFSLPIAHECENVDAGSNAMPKHIARKNKNKQHLNYKRKISLRIGKTRINSEKN